MYVMFQNLPLFSKNHQTKTVTTGFSTLVKRTEENLIKFKLVLEYIYFE